MITVKDAQTALKSLSEAAIGGESWVDHSTLVGCTYILEEFITQVENKETIKLASLLRKE